MFACIFIPDFPVQASLLPETKETRDRLRCRPVAIFDGPSNLPRIAAINDSARALGIEPGMTRLQVETYGGVQLRERFADLEDEAQEVLLECGKAFSPVLESTFPGAVLLDLAGTQRLFGVPQHTACKIAVRVRQAGLHPQIAVAANPDAALYAAQGFPGITVIAQGEEARTLAPLPIGLLPLTPARLDTLQAWGIHTFGALAALPSVALVERLGQEGFALQNLAQGRAARTLRPIAAPPAFNASYEFDDPVETLESLAFVLNRLLDELCADLISHALSTNELKLTLYLEVMQRRHDGRDERSGEEYVHHWKLPVATQDHALLFTLMRLDLERNTFSAPVREIFLEAVPSKPRLAQGNLFAPPSPEAEKLEITLARIRGVVGVTDEEQCNCAGMPRLVDTHRPDAFSVDAFSSAKPGSTTVSALAPMIALRAFRPALESAVELTGNTPHFVRLWKKYRRVLAASGPWCSSGDWWKDSIWSREEWDVALQTTDGVGYYRIYLDRIKKQWFVAGVFD
ncbi:MAG: DNA polymerase Y family protein [Acidobacteria bacterium]|nr:DNA polymerase Y family protein [Acidobacteriota bacterium]